MATYLRDISVPKSAIAEVENDVRKQLSMGEIGLGDIGDAIEEGLEDYARGIPQRMSLPKGQRRPRHHSGQNHGRHLGWGKKSWMVPAPQARRRLEGLGDALTDAAAAIAGGVQTGQVPPGSIDQAINAAVSAITGQPLVAKPPASSMSDTLKNIIPIGMLALLAGAAFLMSGSGGKKYRRNPSRRYRSRGSRSGGGIDPQTMVLWGGGALAAYFLLLRPGSPLMPAAIPRPGVPNTTAPAIASAIPSLTTALAKLFGGGSSTPTTTSPTGGSQFVTNYSQLQSQPAAPSPSDPFAFNTIS